MSETVGGGRLARDSTENREGGITILIRGRNLRPFLARALRSAFDALECLDAEGIAAEIIFVDLGSKDGSQKLLRSIQAVYEVPRLRMLCLDEKRPTNDGFRGSAYRLVCVMSARNELLPANLPVFVRSALDTGAAMVYGNVMEKRGSALVGVRSNMPVMPGLSKSRRVDGFCIVNALMLEEAGEIAAFADANGTEGWEMALRLSGGEGDIVFVPAVLGYRHEWAGDRESDAARARSAAGRTNREAPDVRAPARIYHPEVGFMDE